MKLAALVLALALAANAVARPVAPFLTTIADTGSMRPTLMGGEVLKVLPCAFANVPVGAVIVFEDVARGLFIVHRVIARGRAGNGKVWLRTKGDANRDADPWRVCEADFMGVLDVPFRLAK